MKNQKGAVSLYMVIAIVVALVAGYFAFRNSDFESYRNRSSDDTTYRTVTLNANSNGAPSSPLDIKIKISPFSVTPTTQDYVGLITLELSAREGYPEDKVNWQDVETVITLPESIQLVSGSRVWNTDIIGNVVKENTFGVKILSDGEHHLIISSKKELPEEGYYGDREDLYIFLANGEVIVSSNPIIQGSNQGIAVQICPSGKMFDVNLSDCIDDVGNSDPNDCPEGQVWDLDQSKCVFTPAPAPP